MYSTDIMHFMYSIEHILQMCILSCILQYSILMYSTDIMHCMYSIEYYSTDTMHFICYAFYVFMHLMYSTVVHPDVFYSISTIFYTYVFYRYHALYIQFCI